MSVAMNSSTETIRVYVRLLDEGTVVFRPAPAVLLGAGTVKLLTPSDYDPIDENWEFKPGSIVQTELRTLEGELAEIAVTLAKLERPASYLYTKATRGNRAAFEAVLAKVPDVEPEAYDR